ncbi:ATP-binding protein [Paludisphaera rhizosphaerae]|uniref:ATP-binding protein n=1 Tax=Paludisphaera rhizosphaerae TaxID=2711216 RepID=UPI0013EA174B|nr:AAA family ATPase [Paludisphaera rhizosphaerae]
MSIDPKAEPAAPPAVPTVGGDAAASDGLPAWAAEIAELFSARASCLFVLHGNVHDIVRQNDEPTRYGSVPELLADQLFGRWDVVLTYDVSRGLDVFTGSDGARRLKMLTTLSGRIGEFKAWPRDADAVLATLDRLIQFNLMEDARSPKRLSIAVFFDFAQFLVPSSDLSQLSGPIGSRLVRFLAWAQDPLIKQSSTVFCLFSDQLSEVNERLVGNAHVTAVAVPMPDSEQRRKYIEWIDDRDSVVGNLTDFSSKQLADLTSGLNLVSLGRLLDIAQQTQVKLEANSLKKLKKGLIERQARGLVEFVEPPTTMDDFVGNEGVKKRLIEDAKLLAKGRLDAAPMGYLICGPVGTGKTYLAECFAGSVGVPCVKLRNFRSKYVGETEGNLEQLLNVLRAMGPVVVVIDEADAALGTREGSGDSGTSSRVFSMIASQMGDTRYRGKLIWMLLTSRPDLLPIDLKRQGRAEVHLPLFNPPNDAEVREMFLAMARKNKFRLDPSLLPDGLADRGFSGADIESIVLSAKRLALTQNREQATAEDVKSALEDFVPSAQGLEKEKQELAAVLECTSKSFLPNDWKERLEHPDARAKLQERMAAIKRVIEE